MSYRRNQLLIVKINQKYILLINKLWIYRIDGNNVYNQAIKGLSYHKTKESAETHLKEMNFYLETRKWKDIGGHEPGTPNDTWYNIKLSDDGYHYDNTEYRQITTINVKN